MDRQEKEYETPNAGGNVWPEDKCPAYTKREGSIDGLSGCWYCRYADFHLKQERALDIGVCKWPSKIMD